LHVHLEHNSPYLRVRLKRTQKKGTQIPIDINAPVWVMVKRCGRWVRVKKCENETKAIDLMAVIASELRRMDDLASRDG